MAAEGKHLGTLFDGIMKVSRRVLCGPSSREMRETIARKNHAEVTKWLNGYRKATRNLKQST